ncbi:heavy-metal-associated domain-containing protein, partial [Candidatus Peregrinibacteria bacterium]|nr:heavy-metal-associated domain-containing protein [Candidatus Peregrinibacteria bacterium]
MEKHNYSIHGMHCTSCANIIERKLSKLNGVKKATANYATETLELESNEEISLDKLNQIIKPLGYSLGSEKAGKQKPTEQDHHQQSSDSIKLEELKK